MLLSSTRIVELSFVSDVSFEDAIEQGLDSVKSFGVYQAWVKEQRATVEGGTTRYQVNVLATVPLEGFGQEGFHI